MKLKAIFVVLMIGFWASFSAVKANTVLYEQNFDAEPVGWRGFVPRPGKWEWLATGGVQGGTFHFYYPTSATWGEDDFAILGGKNFTDLAYEAKIKINQGNAGIQARVAIDNIDSTKPVLGGYRCILTEDGKLKIQRYRLMQPNGDVGDSSNPLELISKSFVYQKCRWYTLRLEITGNQLHCLVDNELIAEYTDDNSLQVEEKKAGHIQAGPIFTHGTVGFVAHGFKNRGGEAWFDQVMVESVGGDEEPTLAKLLADWSTDGSDLNKDGVTNETDLTIWLANQN